jgi:2,3-bisphosphoglycerate-independent phosphoglycerate mutase
MNKKPILLCVLDGFGIADNSEFNAVSMAKMPNYRRYLKDYPNSQLQTSGLDVGLPEGQMGNSEVGHMTIGAGRVIFQDLVRVNLAIQNRELERHQYLLELVKNLQNSGGTCHLVGLLSDGGVHSSFDHVVFLAKFLAQNKVKVALHAFLDGRDVAQKSAIDYLEKFLAETKYYDNVKIATISGRYFAMDRDNNWDRIQKAYEAIALGIGNYSDDPIKAVREFYEQGITDEFILPTVIRTLSPSPLAGEGRGEGFCNQSNFTPHQPNFTPHPNPLPQGERGQKDGDALLVANFRADRIRQISYALLDPDFKHFQTRKINFINRVALTEYSDQLNNFYQILFPPIQINNSLPEILAKKNLKQLRIAETEKYAHVTFFFSAGREKEFPGEDRILVKSPAVATYDLMPEMSAIELTNKLTAAIASDKYDFIIVNYANPDMVGHSGMVNPAIKACEIIDQQLGILEKAILAKNGLMIISADHGNIECMKDENNQPHTAHTTNPVPFILVGNDLDKIKLMNGKLSDIAPTILTLMKLNQPEEMTGQNLIVLL